MPIEKRHEFAKPAPDIEADLLRRARAAWQQGGEGSGPALDCAFKLHKGLGYVVLRGASDVLAVYRVRPDNLTLRRLKRWPVWVEK